MILSKTLTRQNSAELREPVTSQAEGTCDQPYHKTSSEVGTFVAIFDTKDSGYIYTFWFSFTTNVFPKRFSFPFQMWKNNLANLFSIKFWISKTRNRYEKLRYHYTKVKT